MEGFVADRPPRLFTSCFFSGVVCVLDAEPTPPPTESPPFKFYEFKRCIVLVGGRAPYPPIIYNGEKALLL